MTNAWISWTSVDVCTWLDSLGLGAFKQSFADNAITGEILPTLTLANVQEELRIDDSALCEKILEATRALVAVHTPTELNVAATEAHTMIKAAEGTVTKANESTMLTLYAAVVGDGTIVFDVDVSSDDAISIVRNAIIKQLRYTFPGAKPTLYRSITTDDGPWLSALDPDLRALQQTPVPEDMRRKYLTDSSQLNVAMSVEDYFKAPFLAVEAIHILVVIPTPASHKRPPSSPAFLLEEESRGIEWVLASTDCPKLDLPPVGCGLRIPQHYLEDAGVVLPVSDGKAMMYIRREVQDEWNNIQELSVDIGSRLWIVGATGVGKSCAAYAFACSVDRTKWDVMWIHFDRNDYSFQCIKYVSCKKWSCTFPVKDAADSCESMMKPWMSSSSSRLIVFFDGYNMAKPACEAVKEELIRWQVGNRGARRLVFVTSMSSRGKEHNVGSMNMVVGENGKTATTDTMFTLASWSLDEYVAAAADNDFFLSVRDVLESQRADDSSEVTTSQSTQLAPAGVGRGRPSQEADAPSTARELVERKFYLAGGSARSMFTLNDSFVIGHLKHAVRCPVDFVAYFTGRIGAAAPHAVSCLLAGYVDANGDVQDTVVSQFAVRLLAIKIGPEQILKLTKTICQNPAMEGFAFEAYVLSSVSECGMEYTPRDMNLKPNKWPTSAVRTFDPAAPSSKFNLYREWNVPIKWNQSGYDAVIARSVEEDDTKVGLVFLRMTRSKNHSFSAAPFYELLHKVREAIQPQRVVVEMELWYVVPMEVLQSFNLPTSTCDFQKEVVQVAYPGTRAATTKVRDTTQPKPSVHPPVKCAVHVMGVKYPKFYDFSHLWQTNFRGASHPVHYSSTEKSHTT